MCVFSAGVLEDLHPRFDACYMDEDLMLQLGKIACRTHVLTLDTVTLGRYRALLQLFVFT